MFPARKMLLARRAHGGHTISKHSCIVIKLHPTTFPSHTYYAAEFSREKTSFGALSTAPRRHQITHVVVKALKVILKAELFSDYK